MHLFLVHRPEAIGRRRLKVAQLLYCGLGGHGSVAFSLIAGDTERTWTHALCFIGIEPLLPAYAAQCADAGIGYRYVPTRPGKPWRSWRAVRQWLETERPDALIVHSATALPVCLRFAARHNVPVIVVEHSAPLIRRSRDWGLSAVALLLADRTVLVSSRMGAAMEKRFGRRLVRAKASVIPNGVDSRLFHAAGGQDAARASVTRLGMAGRFAAPKRQAFLVSLIERLRARTDGREWQLTLAGDGEKRGSVERLATDTEQHVAFAGMLAEAELARWFRTLDIYVHASDGEAQSTAILQAMASALPVVASDVDGLSEQVESGFGLTLTNGDPGAWVEALRELADAPDRRAAMGREARRRCEEEFSAPAMHARYDQLIRDCRERRGAAAAASTSS